MPRLETHALLAPVQHDKGDELPLNQWDKLEEGHCVLIKRVGDPLLAGEIDVRTQDGSVFWVWLDGGRGRIAVYDDGGTSVWLPKSTVT